MDSFTKMQLEALKLPRNEIARHASVSTNNRHKCQSCFCCACVEALQTLREADEVELLDPESIEAAAEFYDRLT